MIHKGILRLGGCCSLSIQMSVKCESLTVGLKYFSYYTNVALGLRVALSFDGKTCWCSEKQSTLQ